MNFEPKLFAWQTNADGTLTLVRVKNRKARIGVVEIPETLDGRRIAAVGDYAFYDCSR